MIMIYESRRYRVRCYKGGFILFVVKVFVFFMMFFLELYIWYKYNYVVYRFIVMYNSYRIIIK